MSMPHPLSSRHGDSAPKVENPAAEAHSNSSPTLNPKPPEHPSSLLDPAKTNQDSLRTDGHWSDEVFAHTALNELLVTCVCFRGVFGLQAKGLEFQGLEFRLSSLAFRFRRLEFRAPECPGERERETGGLDRPLCTGESEREKERERESVCVCVCV